MEGDGATWATLEQRAAGQKKTLEEAILEIDFLLAQSDFPFKNIAAASAQHFKGLLSDAKSHLEIRINGRKKRMIFFKDLLDQQNSLFSIYDVQRMDVAQHKARTLAIVEKEVGLIASYHFNCAQFNLDELTFEVLRLGTDVEELCVLTRILYKGIVVKSASNDSVQTSSYSVFCNYGN
jgi:hypothetical protein